MDTLTHAFAAYALFTLLRRPRAHRVAAAVGAAAPDIDGLFAWASHAHELAFPLVHRGFTHTLWGAPLMGTAALYFASRPFFTARWKRWGIFQWRADTIGPLWVGSFTHLLLDGLTITGIPLLWPLDGGRYTTDWFFFGVQSLLPISLVAWIWIWRGKATDAFVARVTVILAVVLLVAGVIRVSAYPAGLDGSEDVTPGPVEWTWYVSKRVEGGVMAYESGWWGVTQGHLFFPEANRTAAEDALRACEQRPQYLAWEWQLWGLPLVNATRTTDGGWRIEYWDTGTLYANRAQSLGSLRSIFGQEGEVPPSAACVVSSGGGATFFRDRGWFGS